MLDVFNDGFGTLDVTGVGVLVGQLRDAVVVADRTGRVLLTNRAEEIGAHGAPVHLRDLRRGVRILRPDGEPYDEAERPLSRTLSSGEVITGEVVSRVGASGTRQSFRCACAPIRDEHGGILAAATVGQEITPCAAEEAAGEAADQLMRILDGDGHELITLDAGWATPTSTGPRWRGSTRRSGRA